ncbi:transglutaminase family protein [Mangrovimicrobium sediminis]|uniref:Transglutaminase family protein n=1 Tax=Mangrovimicrobium sediminis TaxID=2562682 RepID=A0A4Z0M6S2_9GAMM|nr:transglutaminase family protein [Haliea sp. SAOS-164]TGD75108.1 transglutaminase family protein [Haliea sp. SAOS-164]
MHFEIKHETRYRYSSPVQLGPQFLRFRPRSDDYQRILSFRCEVQPQPSFTEEYLDGEGNPVLRVDFAQPTDHLSITVFMQVATQVPPLAGVEALPGSSATPPLPSATAYLLRRAPNAMVDAFAASVALATKDNVPCFLHALTRTLFNDFHRQRREIGAPQSPVETLQLRRGACRDLTVLFVDCCRSRGIPARFASGYHRGDPQRAERDLHAWPEVFIHGLGWRGFDPTRGVAVTDTHVTIAAAADPADTMPVTGGFSGVDVTSDLKYAVRVRVRDDVV